MTTIIEDFLETAPGGTGRVLQALAEAESLTDDVARQIYEIEPIEGVSADLFVRALHYANFTVPRNSEWHFVPEVRRELQGLAIANPELLQAVNTALIHHGDEGDPALAGSVIPGYLFTDAGKAYHKAALGITDEALMLYAKASAGPLTGAQWLASKLADEQEARGALPADSIETIFLRAMVLFREGRRQEAEPLLRRVAQTDETRIEVAIALNILGNLVGRRNSREAEAFFRRSVEIGEKLGNQHHVAQTLHSLANLLARERRRHDEAEAFFRRSVEIGEKLGNQHHVAQTLHSLANLLGRDQHRRDEAERLYRGSIEIDESLGNRHGVAQTLHSLANLLARERRRDDEAEVLYRRSIEIDESLGNRHGVAQTLHSLANLLARERRRHDEAEELYRRSIEILQGLKDQHGVAQTLHGLANLLGRVQDRRDEAEKLLRESLQIGEDLKNLRHQAQVLRSLSFVVEHRSAQDAEQLLQKSLELNQRARDRRGETLVRQSLQQLRDRYRL